MQASRLSRVVIALACFASRAPAQRPALSNGTFKQCYEAVRPADLRRVAGFISSDAQDSARAFLKPVQLLLDIVGERLRTSLGAKPGELPIGEPAYTKDNLHGSIHVTLFRDGKMSAALVPDTAFPDSAQGAGTQRIAKILRAAWDEGERVFWPEKAKHDSATFKIFFWAPPPKKDGSAGEADARFAVAAFSIALPWLEHATVDDLPTPVYPDSPRSHNVQGTVTMSFAVDTTGYALISTMHDVLPRGAPIPVGEMADYYRDFVRAAAVALTKARFHPATLAGCRYPERVLLPFEFKLSTVR